jgi:type VI secretion system protein ImpJ
MRWNGKVIWSEGIFLRPHHFQQHDRYIENLIEQRNTLTHPYLWGLSELSIDQDQLALGKVAIKACQGILPDGTTFTIPHETAAPPPIDLFDKAQRGAFSDSGTVIYLAIPTKRAGEKEVGSYDSEESLTRYLPYEQEIYDSNSGADSSAQIQMGELRLRLLSDSDDRSGYHYIGLVQVTEVRSDRNIILNHSYIPPLLNCHALPTFDDFINEICGLLHTRGEALSATVTQTNRGGTAEIADFLLLQLINRYEPLLRAPLKIVIFL